MKFGVEEELRRREENKNLLGRGEKTKGSLRGSVSKEEFTLTGDQENTIRTSEYIGSRLSITFTETERNSEISN